MTAINERERYARQISLPEIGKAGQKKLASSSVLLVGVGGLGSPAAFYLAAAGVANIGLMDPDAVETSNLQRQILHFTPDVGRKKVTSAQDKLELLNPGANIMVYPEKLTIKNAFRVLRGFDFIIDATDNFSAKFLIADACHALKKPYSHAGILEFSGQTMTVIPGQTACYRCVFISPPKDAKISRGPLGAVPGVVGAIQALEAIKFLLKAGALLTNRLLVFDALKMNFREVAVRRNPSCPLCGRR